MHQHAQQHKNAPIAQVTGLSTSIIVKPSDACIDVIKNISLGHKPRGYNYASDVLVVCWQNCQSQSMVCKLHFMLARLLGFTLGNRGGLAPKIDCK